jgi:hypothetical protein
VEGEAVDVEKVHAEGRRLLCMQARKRLNGLVEVLAK